MKVTTTLVVLACGLAFTAPAHAQDCTSAPGAPGSATLNAIQTATVSGYDALRQEQVANAAQRRQTRERREQQFRNVSLMHWRWICDYGQRLVGKPAHRALALVEGVLFFDLAEDVTNMRLWYDPAKAQVTYLASAGTQMPTYRSRPINELLQVASQRLVPAQRKTGGLYFCVGTCGSSPPVPLAPPPPEGAVARSPDEGH